MTCPECGHEGSRVVNFCTACGVPVPSGVVVNRRDPATISNTLRWGVLAATVVVPFVGILMGLVYVIDARVPQKELGRRWLAAGVLIALVDAVLVTRL